MCEQSTLGPLLLELGYLSERDAAAALGLHEQTLAQYRRQSIGPEHAQLARLVVYSRSALQRWLESGGTRGRDQ